MVFLCHYLNGCKNDIEKPKFNNNNVYINILGKQIIN